MHQLEHCYREELGGDKRRETLNRILSPQDRWKRTPLDDALAGAHEDIVKFLKDHGAILGDVGELERLLILSRASSTMGDGVGELERLLMFRCASASEAQVQSSSKVEKVIAEELSKALSIMDQKYPSARGNVRVNVKE